jgi:hypothetical protein
MGRNGTERNGMKWNEMERKPNETNWLRRMRLAE